MQACISIGFILGRVACAPCFIDVGARLLYLRLLPRSQARGAFGNARLVLTFLDFHLLLQDQGLELHERLPVRELLPFALGAFLLKLIQYRSIRLC